MFIHWYSLLVKPQATARAELVDILDLRTRSDRTKEWFFKLDPRVL